MPDVSNRRGAKCPPNNSAPRIVTDSGAEMTTLGSGWRITDRSDLPLIEVGGASAYMGRIHMYKGSGITKVMDKDGRSVLLRAANNALIYPEELRTHEAETLFCVSQLRANQVLVHDQPHSSGGAQCLVINNGDPEQEDEVVIPLVYSSGTTVIPCVEPSDDDLATLPVYDVIDPKGEWRAKDLPTEAFDLQMCNKVLYLRAN